MISRWASDDDDELITQINVALLADVGLVVLLVLMVASSLLSQGTTSCSSHVDDSPAESWPQVLNLEIDAGSQLFIDGDPVDDATSPPAPGILNQERLTRFSFNVSPDALPAP